MANRTTPSTRLALKTCQLSPNSRDDRECEHQSGGEGPSLFNLQNKEPKIREREVMWVSVHSLFGCRSQPWCCWWSPPGIGWWYPGLFASTALKIFHIPSVSKNISKLVLFIERVVGVGDVPEIWNCSESRVGHLARAVGSQVISYF